MNDYGAAPDGFEWIAEPDDSWTLERPATAKGNAAANRCRFGNPPHGAPAAAWLNRGTWRGDTRWWAYCADHLFGRWIEGDRVMYRTLRKREAVSA